MSAIFFLAAQPCVHTHTLMQALRALRLAYILTTRAMAVSSAEQRHVAKPTPMTPFSAVLADACAKMRPALDHSAHQLLFNKKPVDLGLPVRLANIPAGSRLDLVPGTSHDA